MRSPSTTTSSMTAKGGSPVATTGGDAAMTEAVIGARPGHVGACPPAPVETLDDIAELTEVGAPPPGPLPPCPSGTSLTSRMQPPARLQRTDTPNVRR